MKTQRAWGNGVRLLAVALGLVVTLAWAGPGEAVPFTGTPNPALFPVFGTLINFDDRATGTPVLANDYLALGVASIREIEGLGDFARYSVSAQSAPNFVGTGPLGERGTDLGDLGWDGTIQIDLVNLTNRIGIGVLNSQDGPEIVSIYDAAFTLLESFVVPNGVNVYVGFDRPSFDIARLQITGDFFGIDDLQFNPNPVVPEPGTLLLLGSGLAGLGSAAWRRRQRT